MTTDQDRESGTEVRLCAECGHAEDQHEQIEASSAAGSHTVCTECGDAHEFEPRPLDV